MSNCKKVETATIVFTWISFAISTFALILVVIRHFSPDENTAIINPPSSDQTQAPDVGSNVSNGGNTGDNSNPHTSDETPQV